MEVKRDSRGLLLESPGLESGSSSEHSLDRLTVEVRGVDSEDWISVVAEHKFFFLSTY